MELTRDNYYDLEPKILIDIEKCDFIALDLELSGLNQSMFKVIMYISFIILTTNLTFNF